MNRFPTLQALEKYLRLETVLVALVLVTAIAAYMVRQQAQGALEDEVALERQVRAARDDIAARAVTFDPTGLQAELEQLQATTQTLSLPTRQEARQFRSAMVAFAAAKSLRLTVRLTENSVAVGDKEYPSVHYSIIARGASESLVEALNLLKEENFRTAAVRSLELSRQSGQWELILELDVLYQEQGT